MRICFLVLALLALGGCSLLEKAPAPQQEKEAAAVQGYQRFVPMAQNSGGTPQLDFALDTKTGLLCKTWDW